MQTTNEMYHNRITDKETSEHTGKPVEASLEVICLPDTGNATELLNGTMDNLPRHPIGIVSWPEFNYRPEVSFSIAHDNKNIVIRYYVQEQNIRAFYRQTNEPVYEDSCVEFFIAWDEKGYYNLEFNCLGTCLMAFGTDRENRKYLDASVIANIHRVSRIDSFFTGNPYEQLGWFLEVKIPLQVFVEHQLAGLSGKEAKANFYKCGDSLPQPHYLSWKQIDTPTPDFHRPEFMGKIRFA
jgi:hypothetical protein